MKDATTFTRIFGDRQGRSVDEIRLFIRDANFIANLKKRVSSHAAQDSRARGADWSVEFSPTQTHDITERSMFRAILTSAIEDERRLSFVVARDWIEIGDGVMESSVRSNKVNLELALENAFRRVVLYRKSYSVNLTAITSAGAETFLPLTEGFHSKKTRVSVERHFSNKFPKNEEAHAFEHHVTGAALQAGLSVGPSGVKDMGWVGCDARITLSGEEGELDRFASDLHHGIRLDPAT